MEPEVSENLHNEFSNRIRSFAIADKITREKMFPELIEYIKKNLNKEVLEKLGVNSHNQQLLKAKEKVYEQKDSNSGKELWTNSSTIVGITEAGQIWGFFSDRPTDEILKSSSGYGDTNYNFYAPALIKALAMLHVEKSKMKPSLAKNINYLKSIGFPYHAGATLNTIDREKIFFGASGCEINQEFLINVEGRKKEGHFRLAGFWDERFCKTIVKFLKNPNKSTQTSIIIPKARIRKTIYN